MDNCKPSDQFLAKLQERYAKAKKKERSHIDSDNGKEFINNQLPRYCNREHLVFTRGRVGRKNDNAFIESKNRSVVRRLVGYGRYDTQRQVDQLNALYVVYRLYVNHFLPVPLVTCFFAWYDGSSS